MGVALAKPGLLVVGLSVAVGLTATVPVCVTCPVGDRVRGGVGVGVWLAVKLLSAVATRVVMAV